MFSGFSGKQTSILGAAGSGGEGDAEQKIASMWELERRMVAGCSTCSADFLTYYNIIFKFYAIHNFLFVIIFVSFFIIFIP